MSHSETINCEEALRLLAVYLDGELHGAEHVSVQRHLETCRSCYSRGEFERRLKAELSHLGRDDVRPAFEQHIRQLITQFAASSVEPPRDE
ncbi:MAG: anti-sigma factor family protein [Gemmatimonadaceae bacterium]